MKQLLKVLVYFSFIGILSCNSTQEKVIEPRIILKDEIDTLKKEIVIKGYYENDTSFKSPVLTVAVNSGRISYLNLQQGNDTLSTLDIRTQGTDENLTIKAIDYLTPDNVNKVQISMIRFYPNGGFESIIKGFEKASPEISEFDMDAKPVKRSRMSNGNGYWVIWSSSTNTYDTIVFKNGQVEQTRFSNRIDSKGKAQVPPVKLRK